MPFIPFRGLRLLLELLKRTAGLKVMMKLKSRSMESKGLIAKCTFLIMIVFVLSACRNSGKDKTVVGNAAEKKTEEIPFSQELWDKLMSHLDYNENKMLDQVEIPTMLIALQDVYENDWAKIRKLHRLVTRMQREGKEDIEECNPIKPKQYQTFPARQNPWEHSFPKQFSDAQGQDLWRYKTKINGNEESLTWTTAFRGVDQYYAWQSTQGGKLAGAYIGSDGEMSPGWEDGEVFLEWTCPSAGEYRVSALLTNYSFGTLEPWISRNGNKIWQNRSVFFERQENLLTTDGVGFAELDLKLEKGDVITFHTKGKQDNKTFTKLLPRCIWNLNINKLSATSEGNTNYYIDALHGDDNASGLSPEQAWKSLGKANSILYAAGDSILLRSGGVWVGQLYPRGSGTEGSPIVIDKYGEGPKPLILGEGRVFAGVYLFNQENWVIRNLEVTNHNANNLSAYRNGIYVKAIDAGDLYNITIEKCYVHDVSGHNQVTFFTRHKYKWNGGIIVDTKSSTKQKIKTSINNVLIDDCVVRRVQKCGIMIESNWRDAVAGFYPCKNLKISNCIIDDVGGDLIHTCVSDGVVIENCLASKGNNRYGVNFGISCNEADNILLQYNECFLTYGRSASQGIGFDHRSHNQVIQYNYTHHNKMGATNVATGWPGIRGNGPVHRSPNVDAIWRYNISYNDGEDLMTMGIEEDPENALLYNNTMVFDKPITAPAFRISTNLDALISNNIFYGNYYGELYQLKNIRNADHRTILNNNLYYKVKGLESFGDQEALVKDPLFISSDFKKDWLMGMRRFQIKRSLPGAATGNELPYAQKDIFGNKVSKDSPTIGAVEKGGIEKGPKTDDKNSLLQSPIVAYIGQSPVTLHELRLLAHDLRSSTLAYFTSKYGVAYEEAFWSRAFKGENPTQLLIDRTLEVCKKIESVQRLGKEKGLLNTTDYQFFYNAFQNDKAYRQFMETAGRGVVGPKVMSEREYYSYIMNVLEAEIIDLTGEAGFKEESQKYFEGLDITIQNPNLMQEAFNF